MLVDVVPECLLNYGARGMSYVIRLRAPVQQAAIPGRVVCEQPLPYLSLLLCCSALSGRGGYNAAQVRERYPAG